MQAIGVQVFTMKGVEKVRKKTMWQGMTLASVFWATMFCGASEIEFVTVGDSGNEPYPYQVFGQPLQMAGGVNYVFRLGKYELTQAQYLEFLNKADPKGTNAYKLFSTNSAYCDFTLDSTKPEGQRYAVKDANAANLPVIGVTWYSAARFCNWLHNGKGGPGSTEGNAVSGAYDTRNFDDGDASTDPATHNSGAKFWIPTRDEWFKAAYYKGGGINAGYWQNPMCGDIEPYGGMPTGDSRFANAYARSRQNPRPPCPGVRVAVGSYPNAKSPYGCLDMAGNGDEWSERIEVSSGKITRRTMGGVWYMLTDHLTLFAQLNFVTHLLAPSNLNVGVRIAALPMATNNAPVANNQSVTTSEDTAKAITLTGSDAEGNALTFVIVTNPAHGTLSGSGANRTYTPAANYNGSESFTFKVNDGTLDSNIATVSITVTAVNDAPVIVSGPTATPNPPSVGQTVTFALAASDVDGDALSYAWNFGDGAVSSGASPVHAYAAVGSYAAVVTVADGKGGTVAGSVIVTVVDGNPPEVSVTMVVLKGVASDAEGAVTVTVNGATATIAGDGSWSKEFVLNNGHNVFAVKATDSSGNETNRTITVVK
jgi:formylglycine-generating enzyme required for sulfatase activity